VTARATGVGSLPGDDLPAALRLVTDELGELLHLPELPGRGATSTMVARGVAVLSGLGADLQPAGWRLTDAPGLDQRRAVSRLAEDLDLLEEHTQGYTGPLKVQLAGPWTLAATMERPRGDRLLADHGARRELGQSLAEGVAAHVADVARRVPGAQVVVQVDEPALPAVLAGAIPTASGFSRHRSVDAATASAALEEVVRAVTTAGGRPVAHCCAADVPVALMARAGFTALSFDLSLARPGDAWAEAWEGGVDLWPGVVPAVAPEQPTSDSALVEQVLRFFDRIGHDAADGADRIVVTPACGLAGADRGWAREALRRTATVAGALG
jgi:methionine synthase II (cobalamin-independent)